MAAPIVETIWLVNGFKRHIVMAAPSSVQNLMNSSSRRFNGKSMSLDDRDYGWKQNSPIGFGFWCSKMVLTMDKISLYKSK